MFRPRRPCRWGSSREPCRAGRAAGVGDALRHRSGGWAADDDRTPAGRGRVRGRDPRRPGNGPARGRVVRVVPVRRPAGRGRAGPRVRHGDCGGGAERPRGRGGSGGRPRGRERGHAAARGLGPPADLAGAGVGRRRGAGVAAMKPRFGIALLRLFAVQGSWNYERMIGLGAGVAEEPLLRGLLSEGNGTAYRDAVARGAHFFNAHPYLVGLAVGAAARAEVEHAPPQQIERLRAALTGPLGSLGDRLVWAGWLPLTIGLALSAA